MSSATTVVTHRKTTTQFSPAFRSVNNAQTISNTGSTVFVVDRDVCLRQSLDILIRSHGWQAQTFGSAEELLTQPRSVAPSCLILGFCSAHLDDLSTQRAIARDRPGMPIIVISNDGDVSTAVKATKAGAVDYLAKPLSDDLLLSAVRQSLILSRAALDREMEMRALRACYDSLTPREREVTTLVASGFPNKLIGVELGISEITVKMHRGNAMRKMKAGSFAQLVHMASRLRVLRPLTPIAVSA